METSESHRIARELHDGIAQDLIALGYSIDLILAEPTAPIEIRSQLRTLRFEVDDLVSKVRREIFELRELSDDKIGKILSNLAVEICGERLASVSIDEFYINDEQSQLITHIASELLRNSARHSGGSRIDISLSKDENQILLEISDNGCGGAHISSHRFGLRGICERLEQASGALHLTSDSTGTRALVLL